MNLPVWTPIGVRPGHDVALVFVSFLLVCVMVWAFVGVLRMREALVGKRGYSLTNTMTGVVGSIVIGSVLSLIQALLILIDRAGTTDTRVLIFLAEQVIRTVGVLYGMRGVVRIALQERDRHDGSR